MDPAEEAEWIVDLAERLRALGVVKFTTGGGMTIEFARTGSPALVPWAPEEYTSTKGPEPAPSPARPKNLREAAERQGIGPLPFPGAAPRDGAI